ncbi:MAG: GNAT family N-acetyltransferase [Maioricimonas sp. JB049]
MSSSVTIMPLANHPESLPLLIEWFEQQWAPYYGPDGPGDAAADLRGCCNTDQLPIALVAFTNGRVCGTAALKAESVTTHSHLTPWLAALLVAPEFRRRGIAGQLIAAVEQTARQLGFEQLYVGTGEGSGTAESTIRRRGWEFVEKGPYFVSEVSIYVKRLA